MAHKTISEEAFLDNALDMLRSRGYQGVSMSQLSAANGLEKASVFYRYPGGKNEVVLAVVDRVGKWFESNVFAPLAVENTPQRRVALAAAKLQEFYQDGKKSCITDVLSIDAGSEEIAAALRVALEAWLKAFTLVAKDSGMSLSVARLRAEEAIARIEGGLVLSRVLRDAGPFMRAIRALPHLLTDPA